MRTLACVSLVIALAGVSGCGMGPGSTLTPVTTAAPKATGMVHGGQNPVTGATIQLWTVGTTGFGSAATPLISTVVTTSDGTGTMDSNANAGNENNMLPAGSFTLNFNGAYTCPATPPSATSTALVYLTATGGNPGLGGTVNNSAIVLLAPLGQCGLLTSTTFVIVNEVTTAATAEALAPFLSASGSIGSPSDSASLTAIANAFAAVNTMVNIATGSAQSGYPKLSTLANAVVPCVNSTGPSNCTLLFTDATPSGGTTPSTVLGVLLDIALNPTLNGTAIYNLSTTNAPFQPALTAAPILWNITTSSAAKSSCGGGAGGGDDVSGSVTYSGAQKGRVYLALNNTGNCDIGTQGTSISITAPGTYPYTIHGVPPATYTLAAFMDTQGYGNLNAADPTGSTSSFGVGAANVTAPTLTLTDPATVTITSAPTLNSVGPYSGGAIIQYKGIGNNGFESATSYTLQWSESSTFPNTVQYPTYSQTFPATGSDIEVWFIYAANHPELTNSSVFYFRAYGASAGTSQGPYSTIYGPVTIGPVSSGSTVSGAVTFTGTATGPMGVGLYNEDNNTVGPYLQYVSSPANTQGYSVNVPNSTSPVYIPVAEIDQNNDGVIDWGDITNVNLQPGPIAVTGNLANQNFTLPSGNSIAEVLTQHYQSGSTQSYSLYFEVIWGRKLPVVVTLLNSYNTDGANVYSGPMDLASCAVPPNSCNQGESGFQLSLNLGATAPSVGDSYFINVTYSDGSSEILHCPHHQRPQHLCHQSCAHHRHRYRAHFHLGRSHLQRLQRLHLSVLYQRFQWVHLVRARQQQRPASRHRLSHLARRSNRLRQSALGHQPHPRPQSHPRRHLHLVGDSSGQQLQLGRQHRHLRAVTRSHTASPRAAQSR